MLLHYSRGMLLKVESLAGYKPRSVTFTALRHCLVETVENWWHPPYAEYHQH